MNCSISEFPADQHHPLVRAFHDFVADVTFPCVGAKSALGRGQLEIFVARDICSNWDDLRVTPHLIEFARGYRRQPVLFQSFVLIFEGPDDLDEADFERSMWQRIQSFSDKDSLLGNRIDNRVASDPADPNFSLSFGGEAFFVVGLHPRASRPARRFGRPALVFNLHDQFERLRLEGRYDGMREKIIDRDVALAGSVNPMLRRHGEASEARQYSGRIVDEKWQCPFERRSYAWPPQHSSALSGRSTDAPTAGADPGWLPNLRG